MGEYGNGEEFPRSSVSGDLNVSLQRYDYRKVEANLGCSRAYPSVPNPASMACPQNMSYRRALRWICLDGVVNGTLEGLRLPNTNLDCITRRQRMLS